MFVGTSIADIAKDIHSRYPDFSVVDVSSDKQGYVVVMQKELSIYPNAGPIYNPRLLVTSAVGLDEYRVELQVFFKSICCEKYDIEAVNPYLQTMKPGSGYIVCPGVPNLPGEICFKPKKYRE